MDGKILGGFAMTRKILTVTLSGLLCASMILAASPAARDADASSPTFYKDVLPILQDNCQSCHRSAGLNLGGMIAPMSFGTYKEVRPWAKSMARVVSSGEMPPWHASSEYNGVFHNERVLSDDEINTIVRWARAGARAGDASDAPPPLGWPESTWAIGEPDLILQLEEPFHVEDDLEDLNIDLMTAVKEGSVSEDRYITAIEFKPGSTAVHHIIGYTIAPGEAGPQMLGGIAPGTQPNLFPEGYGVKMYAGSKFLFQMHYHKEPGPGTEAWDRSSVGIKFADKPVKRLHITPVGDPRKLYVPANTKDVYITSDDVVPRDVTIIALLPHMHLRGSYAKYTAFLPDGTQKDFLEVPKYDFNWQTSYEFTDYLELPAGTRIEVTCGYDNTADNPNNPDPTVDVKWGDATTDEMNLGWMTWAWKDGDDSDLKRSFGEGTDLSAFGEGD